MPNKIFFLFPLFSYRNNCLIGLKDCNNVSTFKLWVRKIRAVPYVYITFLKNKLTFHYNMYPPLNKRPTQVHNVP